MGEIPTEMVKTNVNNFVYDIFGQQWQIFISSTDTLIFLTSWHEDGSSFLSSSSADSLAICKNILIAAKENSDSINRIAATSANSDSAIQNDDATSHYLYGDNYCSANRRCLKNLTLDDIYTTCSEHVKGGKAAFQLMWRRN